jgi:hypothetical protein
MGYTVVLYAANPLAYNWRALLQIAQEPEAVVDPCAPQFRSMHANRAQGPTYQRR